MKRKLTLLVSACLLGLNTTHNGGSNFCPDLSLVQEKAVLVPVCPEQLGGLPTPRPPAEITGADGYGVLAGEAVVLTASGEDKTAAYLRGACETRRLAETVSAAAVLFKARSPSCGNRHIYDGRFSKELRCGPGVAAAALLALGLPVFNEEETAALLAWLESAAG
ncbi:MAG: hypothetical protein DDT21_01682 [Syntrophomonadaceae bacterium]|nr:hypothetical protein [Bacillota bacterium]